MRRVARAEQGVRTAAEPTETVASTSRTVERHRVSAIATGGRVVGPRRYRSASAIARSLRQASATASPRARAASSCTSAGSRRSKKRRFLQILNTPFALNAWVLYLASVPRRRAENSAFHLPAHHVTSPDTSRGETQHARLKSVQSQNAPSLFSCAKSLRRRISSQIGWLTQNSERGQSAS